MNKSTNESGIHYNTMSFFYKGHVRTEITVGIKSVYSVLTNKLFEGIIFWGVNLHHQVYQLFCGMLISFSTWNQGIQIDFS